MTSACLHPQCYPAQQLFFVILADETYRKAFIVQVPINFPSLNKHRGSVVVYFPPVAR